jgi:hypothetical protein
MIIYIDDDMVFIGKDQPHQAVIEYFQETGILILYHQCVFGKSFGKVYNPVLKRKYSKAVPLTGMGKNIIILVT